MNDEHHIERLLSELPLQAPSSELDDRILSAMPARRLRISMLAWAASVALVGFVSGYAANDWVEPRGAVTGTPVAVANDTSGDVAVDQVEFEPRRIDLVWRQVEPQGTWVVDDGAPVQALRHREINRTFWVDAERNITVELARPSERVIFIREPSY